MINLNERGSHGKDYYRRNRPGKERVFAARGGCGWKDGVAPNGAPRSARGVSRDAAAVRDRNGGVFGCARVGAALRALRAHREIDGAEVRGAVQEERQERRQRCGSYL